MAISLRVIKKMAPDDHLKAGYSSQAVGWPPGGGTVRCRAAEIAQLEREVTKLKWIHQGRCGQLAQQHDSGTGRPARFFGEIS